MQTPLPSKRLQRKEKFRPTKDQIHETYDLLNAHIFEGKLIQPSINRRSMAEFGMCIGWSEPRHFSKILLNRQFFCVQWFVTILAHEMSHQYQWDIQGAVRLLKNKGPLLSHGPSFYRYAKPMARCGIPLKPEYSPTKWFRTQDMMKVF